MTWFDKIRLYLIYSVTITLILLAVTFTVLRSVLPHATSYLDDVEQALTLEIGLPVTIASMDADMYWLMPRLKLVDVVIHNKEKKTELLRVNEAIFSLAFADSILQGKLAVGDVSLIGANLNIERLPNKRWRIQGVEFGAQAVEQTESDSSAELLSAIKNTSFSLLDSNIHWKDYRLRSGQLDFIGANILVEEFLGDHSLEVELNLPEAYGESLRLIVKIEDDIVNLMEVDLDVYLQGKAINIEQFLSVLDIAELPEASGFFSGELWLSRKNNALSKVALKTLVSKLEIKKKSRESYFLNNMTGNFSWERKNTGWSFNSSGVHLVRQGKPWQEPASASVTQDKHGLTLAATYLRSQDLINLATVFVDDELLDKVKKYSVNELAGDFYNVTSFIPANDAQNIKLVTAFENLDFSIPETDIRLQGIDGSVDFADNRAQLELLSEKVVLDFGDLFRKPLKSDLIEASIIVEQVEKNWNITSEDLYLINSDIEINTRLNISIDESGAVLADIQSDFINVIGAQIANYYPVSVMSKDLVQWLNMAIVDGLVESGSFIMHGDVNRFPYADNDGVMEVVFDTSHLTLKFVDDWPPLNNLNSHIRFHNLSLLADNISAEIYRGKVSGTKLSLPNLYDPKLFVDGHIRSPAKDLQKYIWNSDLDEILGATMKQLQLDGDMILDLNLEVPLDSDLVIAKGRLQLNDNDLYLPVVDYALSNISGELFFNGDQLKANAVKARFEGAPIVIDISESEIIKSEDLVEGRVTDKQEQRSETLVHIKGNLPVDGLLKPFEWVPEKWLKGSSDWDVLVHLPKRIEDYSVRVEMDSALGGVTVDLSKIVSKNQGELLPVYLDVRALGGALQIDAKSQDKLTLFATRNNENIWDFVVDSNLIRGEGEFAGDLNKDSSVMLDLEYIDLPALFESESKKEGGEVVSLKPTFFPSLNFKSKKLLWHEWEFHDVSLETNWHSHGMLINSIILHGPSFDVNGRGSWLSSWQHEHESNFKFFVNSSNLGDTLSSLKLSDSIKNCEQSATLDWQWFAEPYRFSWQKLQGTANFNMKNGEVDVLDPGAGGRIVGLFNVFKLADRLTLDFKDVAGKGFAFDSIDGNFEFSEGYATSENIIIDAAAADIRLKGKIGMVDRDYDLFMEIKPRTSAATFTGGTLVGGPVLGAGLVLIYKALGLEKKSYDEYEITGSWEDPIMTKIGDRDQQ